MVDSRIAAAREAGKKAQASAEEAQRHLATRNAYIIQLRKEDPTFWTYKVLGEALGVSIGTIAKITKRVI